MNDWSQFKVGSVYKYGVGFDEKYETINVVISFNRNERTVLEVNKDGNYVLLVDLRNDSTLKKITLIK